jgi:hypothetical protein
MYIYRCNQFKSMSAILDDDVYLKNITTRVSQNLILHINVDHQKHKRIDIQIIKDTDNSALLSWIWLEGTSSSDIGRCYVSNTIPLLCGYSSVQKRSHLTFPLIHSYIANSKFFFFIRLLKLCHSLLISLRRIDSRLMLPYC